MAYFSTLSPPKKMVTQLTLPHRCNFHFCQNPNTQTSPIPHDLQLQYVHKSELSSPIPNFGTTFIEPKIISSRGKNQNSKSTDHHHHKASSNLPPPPLDLLLFSQWKVLGLLHEDPQFPWQSTSI